MIETLRIHMYFRSAWQRQSVNRRIFTALMTVGGFTLVINLVGAVKELVVARQFGTGDTIDALLIAFLLPSYAINVLAGSCSTALVPTLVQVRENEGQQKAQQLLSGVMIWNTAVLAVVSILLALTASFTLPILGSGFGIAKLELTRSLFFVLLPVLVISGFRMTWSAVLNAYDRFALAALSPGMTTSVTIALVLFMGRAWGIYALAVGTLSGSAIEAGLLGWGLRRNGFCLMPRWHGWNHTLRKVIHQYMPLVASALLMSGTILVDQSMAAMLGTGSVATLNYGGRVVTLILGIGSVSLSTAVFPHFSRMVAGYDWTGLRHTLKTYAYLILLVTIPLTLILVFFSKPIVRLLFERGAFTSVDTLRVTQVQILFLLQIPLYSLVILMVRLISSLNMNHVLMQASIINLLSKIIFNYLLIQRLGVAGIALSTTLVYAVAVLYYFVMLCKQIKTV